jgi:uncharacterized protein YbcC (UPF0753/DUF2309 family)
MEPRTHAANLLVPTVPLTEALHAAIDAACARIAPTWPLDRFIAVNPFWELTDRPIAEVASELRALSGAQLLPPREWFREAWRSGRLTEDHLARAIARAGTSRTVEHLRARLDVEAPVIQRRAQLTDVADAERRLDREVPWQDFVLTSISQFCASFFDEGQAAFGPDRSGGLYASWRRFAQLDQAPSTLMGAATLREVVAALPHTADELFGIALLELDVPRDQWTSYLSALLLGVNGWASWCAYRRWTARLAGGDDHTMRELLAVRLGWEWLLHRAGSESVRRRWQLALADWLRVDAKAAEGQHDDWLLQDAMELRWQDEVIAALPARAKAVAPREVDAQVVFCIDVRSEPYRRALEAESEKVQTLGFAGFFGLPIDFLAVGAREGRPQLPGLLAAKARAVETGLDALQRSTRLAERAGAEALHGFKTSAASTFSFVEAFGLPQALGLARETMGLGRSSDQLAVSKPRLAAGPDRVALAAGMLRTMGLTRDFAPVVALVGHGARTRNNPHAAGLDCGACCGQSGEVNARVAAALLNEPEVREGLRARGVEVPEGTRFVAGLHDTTTDEVTLFELDEVPTSSRPDVERLASLVSRASERARAARASSVGETSGARSGFDRRSRDWAQVRPEWGLADNAGFVIAPRERTRGLDLGGRAFLHDYRWRDDEGFTTLELLLTAPMVVTHWINLQYYASTVDNARYGSGNKVLHNVVGGHLGVFEGNAGDLRIGLPFQSIHDGTRWRHEPLRLSVFVEAPEEAIEAVLQKHAKVRGLVEHGWLQLFRIGPELEQVTERRPGGWFERG